jgi:hypothetical protein
LHAWTGAQGRGRVRALCCPPSPRRSLRACGSARECACGCAQGGAMDELGEPVFSDELTLVDEILRPTTYFSESIWPAGIPPDDEEERRAVVASWVARIRATATPPARPFEVGCCHSLVVYASLTDEAAAGLTGLPEVHIGTEEEGCAVMAALVGRLPALRSLNVTDVQLRALVPVWREIATAGRPAGPIHLTVRDARRPQPGAPAALGLPMPPLPPLGDLLPRLQSLHLSVDEPEHVASWCTMLAGEGAPALADLTLPRPSRHRDALPDEQAAMYVDVLRRQAESLRGLYIRPLRMSAGAADALDAAIVALPHLVNLRTAAVQVDGGSVRVLGGRAPHLRKVNVSCCGSTDPAAFLIAWLHGLASSVEVIELGRVQPRLEGLAAPTWRDLASALRALGAPPALRSLSLSARDGSSAQWLQSVVSPPPDVAAAPVWPHLEELVLFGWCVDNSSAELDLRHFPCLRKIGSNIISAAAIAGVMRSAVCRDVWLHDVPGSLTAADAAAFAPKERLVADLSDDTAEETAATLAGVVGGWPELRELRLSCGEMEVSEATQAALAHALGHCTQLRELHLMFPLCPAAMATLAEALPRLPQVTRIEVGDVTTTSLLALVHGLLGTGRHAGNGVRTLRAVVSGTGDTASTTDDLRELGSAVAMAARLDLSVCASWGVSHSGGHNGPTPVELLTQVQTLALWRDWRDCIVPLSTVDVTPAGYTLLLQPCGLVAWDLRE